MQSKNIIQNISVIEFIDRCRGNQNFQLSNKVSAIEFSNIELLNVFKNSFNKLNRNIDAYFPSIINKDWIESKFSNFDLFAQESLMFFYDCETISQENLNLIFEMSMNSNHQVILFFNRDMQKKWPGDGIKIKKAAFWEGDKVFKSLVSFYGLDIDREAYSIIVKHLESNCDEAFSLIETLKTFSSEKISVEQIISLLPKKMINQFEYAELLNKKNINGFFRKLAVLETFEDLSQVLNFSISHLIKMIGPHGAEMNKNKYNKQIIEASVRWPEIEINSLIETLKSITIHARLKNKKAFIETMKASIVK